MARGPREADECDGEHRDVHSAAASCPRKCGAGCPGAGVRSDGGLGGD